MWFVVGSAHDDGPWVNLDRLDEIRVDGESYTFPDTGANTPEIVFVLLRSGAVEYRWGGMLDMDRETACNAARILRHFADGGYPATVDLTIVPHNVRDALVAGVTDYTREWTRLR